MSEQNTFGIIVSHELCECQNCDGQTDSNGKIQYEWGMTVRKCIVLIVAEKELKVKEGWIDE